MHIDTGTGAVTEAKKQVEKLKGRGGPGFISKCLLSTYHT